MMSKDQIATMVAQIDQQIAAIASAVDRLVAHHAEWRRWRDQNYGRELDAADVNYRELTADAARPQLKET